MSTVKQTSMVRGKSLEELDKLLRPAIEDVLQVLLTHFNSSALPHQKTMPECIEYSLNVLSHALCDVYGKIVHIVDSSTTHADLMEHVDDFLTKLRYSLGEYLLANRKTNQNENGVN